MAQPESARGLAEAAAAEFRRQDMPGQLTCAQQLLASLDRGHGSPHGLTARVLEVAALVAQGMTNQQIADRLVLSVRTLESHVRSALAKLQLTSRRTGTVEPRASPDAAALTAPFGGPASAD